MDVGLAPSGSSWFIANTPACFPVMVTLHGATNSILLNRSTILMIISLPLALVGRGPVKSIPMLSHGCSGMGRGRSIPAVFLLLLFCAAHTTQLRHQSSTSAIMPYHLQCSATF